MVRQSSQRVQETPHFRIHYSGDSFAEQQIGTISDRLEKAYETFVRLLGFDGRIPATVEVYLVDVLDDPKQAGAPRTSGGFVAPGEPSIYEVYRPDAPGVTLERSLAQVLVSAGLGPEQVLPPFAFEGLIGWLGQQVSETPAQFTPMLQQWRSQNQVPPLATLVGGPTPATAPRYNTLASAFAGYLIGRYGLAKFLDFARRLDPAHPDPAAKAAFGRTLTKLENDWRKTFEPSAASGILRFVRTSLTYLKPYKLKVAEILVYMLLAVSFSIIMPLTQQRLIDRALLPANTRALVMIMTFITTLFVVVSITQLRKGYVTAWVSSQILTDMRSRIFTLLQRLEPAFFQRMATGDIMSRMSNDLGQIQFALTGAMEAGLRLVLTLGIALITIFLLDWRLGLLAVAGLPLFFISTKFLGPPAARASKQRQQDLATVSSTLQENLLAQPVVKAFGLQDLVTTNYRSQLGTLFRSSIRLTFLSSLYGLSANSIASAIQLTVLGTGGYLIIRGNLTLGALFAFLGLLAQVINPIQGLSGIVQALQQATGSMDRVEELINAKPTIVDAPGAKPIPPLTRAIRLEDVEFSYTGQQPNLTDFTLEIAAGTKVALVGPSGCGKSTVLNLIMRFYEPQRGKVLFDGVDIRDATLESVRGQMGVVFQDNFLFNVSVRENIRMGRLDATDAEVEDAAKAAEIHDLILTFPEGYDTVVGERGGRLSGGQRQRIAIARAIVRNPAILILDEATSALDPRTEAAINVTLDRLAVGRTTVSVTHRLTSAAQMDRIYVLDRGRLVEQGSHEELLQQDGLYARLWHEQTGAARATPSGEIEAARLAAVPLFAGLAQNLLTALANRLALERHAAGDAIVTQGDAGDKLYVIDRGTAEVVVDGGDGSERTLAELHEGDYFGEMALLYDAPRTATVKAKTPVQLLSLTRDQLTTLMTAVPALRASLEATVKERAAALPKPPGDTVKKAEKAAPVS